MNYEEILQARKNYKRMQTSKEKLVTLKKELEEIKENPNSKRYLEICGVKNIKILEEEDIIIRSFRSVNKTKTNFSIYLYMGAFILALNPEQLDSVTLDKNNANYLLYLNLEDENDSVKINPSMQEEFEKKNIVLKGEGKYPGARYYVLQELLYREFLTGDLRRKGKILEKLRENL